MQVRKRRGGNDDHGREQRDFWLFAEFSNRRLQKTNWDLGNSLEGIDGKKGRKSPHGIHCEQLTPSFVLTKRGGL